jgi:DNA-directed RNA polymerase subunit omega
MARVTVEDCIEIVPNRFELVEMASQRVRQITSGTPLTVERDNDKDTIVSLREIADKTIDVDVLREEIIQSHQKYGKTDSIDDNQAMIGRGADITDEDIAKDMADLQADASDEIEDELGDAGFEFAEEDITDAND